MAVVAWLIGSSDRSTDCTRRTMSSSLPVAACVASADFDAFRDETIEAIRRVIPDFSRKELHLNIGHESGHYFANLGYGGVSTYHAKVMEAVEKHRQANGSSLHPVHILEGRYQALIPKYYETHKSPLPCTALSSSCFIDAYWNLFACSIWDEKVGNLRDNGFEQAAELARTEAVLREEPFREADAVLVALHLHRRAGNVRVRVPAVIVSPFVPKGTVDHTLYDHTSILATVERWLGIKPLTKRDEGANDLRPLLSLPAPRKDCPQTLPSPVRAPKEKKDLEENLLGGLLHAIDEVVDEVETVVERVVGDVAILARESLPQSGNVIGFLHVLLKTELEISKLKGEGEIEEARILNDFRKIKTKRQAQAYVKRMYDKIEAQRRN